MLNLILQLCDHDTTQLILRFYNYNTIGLFLNKKINMLDIY